ncbi:hypothetical protein S40293_10820, partial [Stachybotrys chartarum IBT 40293]
MADSPRLNDMSQLMQATEYSDMALICQGIEFKVHRVVVCTQSPVLAAAMRGGFKVWIVVIENFPPETLNLDEWNAQEFIQATKETLSSTGDRSLHEVMALAAAQNISELLKFDEFIELIGHFGADVLRHHIKQGTEEISELRLKTMKLQIDLDEEQTRVRSMEMRAE